MKTEKRELDIVVGKQMKELRSRVNMTQMELANMLGIPQGTYQQYEAGSRMTPFFLLAKLSENFKVPLDYFFALDIFKELSNEEFSELIQLGAFKGILPTEEDEAQMTKFVQEMMGDNIKILRLENSKTKREVAKVLGVNESTYGRYENAEINISNEVIKKLADYYNVSIERITKPPRS